MIRVENTERTGREAAAYYVAWAEMDGQRQVAMFTEAVVRDAVERARANPEDVPQPPPDVAALQDAVEALLTARVGQEAVTVDGVRYLVVPVRGADGSMAIECQEVTP